MANDTERLKLLKKDPLTDGNETFNIQTMLNDNWDKLDEAVGSLQDEIANLDPEIPEGSVTQKGIVQLSSATNSTSETLAATSKAVKAAYDLANGRLGATQITSGSFNPNTLGGGTKIIELKNNGSITYSNMPDQAGGLFIQGEGSHARWLQQMYLSQDGLVYFRSGYDNGGTLAWRAWEKIVTNDQTAKWQKYNLTDVNGRALNISGQDLNNITIGGFYNGSNLANAPDSTSWWYIEVVAHTSTNGYTLQKAYMLNGGVRVMKMRTQENGTWSVWTDVATAGGVLNGGLWIARNTAYGSTTALDLAVGDSDTGFDWVADGQIDFYSNAQVPVRLIGQDFQFKTAQGTYESLSGSINSLKTKVEDGAVKNVQRISAFLPANNAGDGTQEVVVNIAPVNMYKTSVNLNGSRSAINYSISSDYAVTAELINNSQVAFRRVLRTGRDVIAVAEVIEFN